METRIFVDQDGLISDQIRFQQWEAVMDHNLCSRTFGPGFGVNMRLKPNESFEVIDIVGLWSIFSLYYLCQLQKGPFSRPVPVDGRGKR